MKWKVTLEHKRVVEAETYEEALRIGMERLLADLQSGEEWISIIEDESVD